MIDIVSGVENSNWLIVLIVDSVLMKTMMVDSVLWKKMMIG